MDYAPFNIRVNVVSPGGTDTIRNMEWFPAGFTPAVHSPLGRRGTVDEMAAACLFLVSDDCDFITGQTLHVYGGAAFV